MKTIGFVDFYLSEWHANNYPAWIKQANEKLGLDYKVAYAWAEQDLSPVYGKTTEEWCSEYGVEQCATLKGLCEKSDVILVLAPSNPEKHLGYAEEVLKYGKNTYIDKTFAPDFKTAGKIFAIAKQYGTKFFSSSALRYGTELCEVKDAVKVATKGGGSNLPEYIVHQAEMVVKTLGLGAKSVCTERLGDNHYLCKIGYADGRSASMEYCADYPFAIDWESADGKKGNAEIVSDMFVYLIESILKFYESGELPFDSAQTLEVMKIREAAVKGLNQIGKTINL